jgi:hypothetical protein
MARRHLRRLRGLVMVLATLTTVVAAGNLPAAAAAAAVSVRYAASSSWLIGPYEWKTAVATCPAGTKVVGGGEDNSSTSAVLLQSSEPTADGNGWRVAAGPGKYLVDSQPLPIDVTGANTWRAIVYNSSTESNTIHAQALCAVT